MWYLCVVLLVLIAKDCSSQDEDEPYRGKLIGKFNSYHHQVSGDVYAVDDWSVLLVNFNYDGTGDDTFFWAGDAMRPGPQGFIVPDEHNKTNVLERYYNQDILLSLPPGKQLSRLAWLCVFDVATQNVFADVLLPEGFDPPRARSVGPLLASGAGGGGGGGGGRSGAVTFLDSKTVLVPELYFSGGGEVYFTAGVGPQPSAKGTKLTDHYGYLEPLGAYNGSDVTLVLPGALTAARLSWLALWDAAAAVPRGAVLLPEELNVPPARGTLHTYKSALPNCKQLHRALQVSWEVFGNQVTFQLAGQISSHEYMAFGISGSRSKSAMLGADVAVVRYDEREQRAYATDYNITALAPCVQVLGQWQGVCRDDKLGYQDSNQVFTATRDSGLTVVTYRRTLQTVEEIDRAWPTDAPVQVVWAVGPLDAAGEPGFHRLYPAVDVTMELGQKANSDCTPFLTSPPSPPTPWERAELFDPALRTFRFTLGARGGERAPGGAGASGGGAGGSRVWFVNGQMRPDLQLRRGLHYTFKVNGGNDPHSAALYHPLVVSLSPAGGADPAARVLAGLAYTRRHLPTPTAAGPLCEAAHAPGADRRRDDEFPTFRLYNRSLVWRGACDQRAVDTAAELHVAPNASWPDLVYYQSFTHKDMGGRIYIVDRHKRSINKKSAAARTHAHAHTHALAIAVFTILARLAL